MNLPNKITLSRILIVPFFMLFVMPLPDWLFNLGFLSAIKPQLVLINNFIMNIGNYIAAAIFIIASSTDGVDGYIARKHKLVTKLGIFLDPIADKLLTTAALLVLVQRGSVSGWSAFFIIGRELIVTGLRLVAAGEGIVISAGKLGKIKQVTQIVAIAATLLNNFPLNLFTQFRFDRYAMLAAVLITIYSGYDYIAKNINVINVNN